MAHRVVLYHFPPSLCSQKVRLALEEKGVAYMSRIVDIGPRMVNYEPWYMRINPRGVVPTLVHNGRIITDSARIIRYIDEHIAGPALTPPDEESVRWMEYWIDRQDEFPFREFSYSTMPRWFSGMAINKKLKHLRRQLAHYPELSDAYMARIEDVSRWRETNSSSEATGAITANLGLLLDALETHLREQAQTHPEPFLAGASYSLADVAWTVILARVMMMGDRVVFDARPAMSSYYQRMRARPSFEAANIWERPKPEQLAPHMATWAAPRVAAAAAVGLGGYMMWRALTGTPQDPTL